MEATIEEKEPVGALHKWSGQLQDILGLEATPGDEGMMAVEDAVAALIARAGTAGPPMPDKTPLELARETAINILATHNVDAVGRGCNCGCRYCRIAAALVERMTPVEVSVGEMHTIACCKARVSGYPEDYPGRSLPKFCPNCGKPLVWR